MLSARARAFTIDALLRRSPTPGKFPEDALQCLPHGSCTFLKDHQEKRDAQTSSHCRGTTHEVPVRRLPGSPNFSQEFHETASQRRRPRSSEFSEQHKNSDSENSSGDSQSRGCDVRDDLQEHSWQLSECHGDSAFSSSSDGENSKMQRPRHGREISPTDETAKYHPRQEGQREKDCREKNLRVSKIASDLAEGKSSRSSISREANGEKTITKRKRISDDFGKDTQEDDRSMAKKRKLSENSHSEDRSSVEKDSNCRDNDSPENRGTQHSFASSNISLSKPVVAGVTSQPKAGVSKKVDQNALGHSRSEPLQGMRCSPKASEETSRKAHPEYLISDEKSLSMRRKIERLASTNNERFEVDLDNEVTNGDSTKVEDKSCSSAKLHPKKGLKMEPMTEEQEDETEKQKHSIPFGSSLQYAPLLNSASRTGWNPAGTYVQPPFVEKHLDRSGVNLLSPFHHQLHHIHFRERTKKPLEINERIPSLLPKAGYSTAPNLFRSTNSSEEIIGNEWSSRKFYLRHPDDRGDEKSSPSGIWSYFEDKTVRNVPTDSQCFQYHGLRPGSALLPDLRRCLSARENNLPPTAAWNELSTSPLTHRKTPLWKVCIEEEEATECPDCERTPRRESEGMDESLDHNLKRPLPKEEKVSEPDEKATFCRKRRYIKTYENDQILNAQVLGTKEEHSVSPRHDENPGANHPQEFSFTEMSSKASRKQTEHGPTIEKDFCLNGRSKLLGYLREGKPVESVPTTGPGAPRSVCLEHCQDGHQSHLSVDDGCSNNYTGVASRRERSSLIARPLPLPHYSSSTAVLFFDGGEGGDRMRVELCHADLWEAFHRLHTEMIITKAGRRMFPALKMKVSGLQPLGLYRLSLDVVPLDRHKYRYVYHCSKWMVSGSGEMTRTGQRAVHPDSPISGHALQGQVVTFEKVKLTNNLRSGPFHISLASMQRYLPRLHIERVTEGGTNEDGQQKVTEHHVAAFPQTAFMAVTAYQNQEITRLKIAMNPFAKGFRDAIKHTFPGRDPCPPLRHTSVGVQISLSQ